MQIHPDLPVKYFYVYEKLKILLFLEIQKDNKDYSPGYRPTFSTQNLGLRGVAYAFLLLLLLLRVRRFLP